GCAVGLAFLFVFGGSIFSILAAMAISAIISSDVVKVPVSWRIAPITALIIMIPAVLGRSLKDAEHIALLRTGEVLLGSAIAVGVTFATTWFFHLIELRREAGEPEDVEPEAPRPELNIDE
ncbi:MAG TPA: FUSC family protein, partial [Terriglobales bacterium]